MMKHSLQMISGKQQNFTSKTEFSTAFLVSFEQLESLQKWHFSTSVFHLWSVFWYYFLCLSRSERYIVSGDLLSCCVCCKCKLLLSQFPFVPFFPPFSRQCVEHRSMPPSSAACIWELFSVLWVEVACQNFTPTQIFPFASMWRKINVSEATFRVLVGLQCSTAFTIVRQAFKR